MIIGYAAYNQKLNISETSKIDSNFNILITNIEIKEVGGQAVNNGTPEYKGLEAKFDITFNKKNDYIEYNVEVSNKGNIEAYLNQIKINNEKSKEVSMSYRDINVGDKLGIGESKTFVVRVEYQEGSGSGEANILLDYGQENKPGEIILPENYERNKVIYNTEENGGEKGLIEEKRYSKGEGIDLGNVGKKEGYRFVGWNTNKDAKEAIKELIMGEEEITLYAIYKKEIKVRYKIGDGIKEIPKEEDTCEIYNKEETCNIELPSRESIKVEDGRIIDGWYKGEEKIENNIQKVREESIYEIKAYTDTPAEIEINTSPLSNSIRVVTNVINNIEIERYEYSIDNSEYIESNNTYSFNELEHNREYNIKVRVTTKGGKVTEKEKIVRTLEIEPPTFTEEIDGIVKITYPEECESRYTCTYIKDNGEEVTITKNPEEVIFSSSGTIIAKVTDGTNYITSSTYTVTMIGEERNFNYTGNSQEFVAPASGYYKIELWGAAGGSATYTTGYSGGKGSYTTGEIYLNKDEILYVYIGGQGTSHSGTTSDAIKPNGNGYNGGTTGKFFADNSNAGGGGGATDIRLEDGEWSSETSLRSRIMVAAGGGGGVSHLSSPNFSGTGGNGGTLIGANPIQANTTCYNYGTGGTQSSGGITQKCEISGVEGSYNGLFGSTELRGDSHAGGGSGYYGGAAAHHGAGGGGSSYISGYAGVNSVVSRDSTAHTNQTLHYSGKYFINTNMQVGTNNGNGKAKITYIKNPSSKDSEKIKNVRYIKDCTNGNSGNDGNHWLELQAISNGINVAKDKNVTATADTTTGYYTKYVVDGIMDNIRNYASVYTNNQCITVDLGKAYNLEEIAIWHYYGSSDRIYKDNVTSVAGNDGVYRTIYNGSYTETATGHHIK